MPYPAVQAAVLHLDEPLDAPDRLDVDRTAKQRPTATRYLQPPSLRPGSFQDHPVLPGAQPDRHPVQPDRQGVASGPDGTGCRRTIEVQGAVAGQAAPAGPAGGAGDIAQQTAHRLVRRVARQRLVDRRRGLVMGARGAARGGECDPALTEVVLLQQWQQQADRTVRIAAAHACHRQREADRCRFRRQPVGPLEPAQRKIGLAALSRDPAAPERLLRPQPRPFPPFGPICLRDPVRRRWDQGRLGQHRSGRRVRG